MFTRLHGTNKRRNFFSTIPSRNDYITFYIPHLRHNRSSKTINTHKEHIDYYDYKNRQEKSHAYRDPTAPSLRRSGKP